MSERVGITAGSIELIGGAFGIIGLGHLYSGHIFLGIGACVAFTAFQVVCYYLALAEGFHHAFWWFYAGWLVALALSPFAVIRRCRREHQQRNEQAAGQGTVVARNPDWTQDFADG